MGDKMKNIKNILKMNHLSYGSWITISDPSIGEVMAQAGFDWLTIDMEHSVLSLNQAQQLIRVIELYGTVPFVRVGENNPTIIKRVMDAGAHGVIVPMVNTKEDAKRAVDAVKYPPGGSRGVGLARAQGYGFTFEQYRKWVHEESVVIAQIEHVQAINNLESILSVDGIDGSMIGPYDLSGSLGYPGEFDRPEVNEAILQYENMCKKMKKPMGFHVVQPDPIAVTKYIDKGYSFLAVGVDFLYLGTKCREIMQRIVKR